MKQTKNKKQIRTFRTIGAILAAGVMATLCCVGPSSVFALGTDFTLSKSNMTLDAGTEDSLNITSKRGVGKLNVVSTNSSVAEVSDSAVFIDNPGDSQSIKVTAKAAGFTTIQVISTDDYADFETEDPMPGQIAVLNVTVKEAPAPTPTPGPVEPTNEDEELPVPNTSGSDTKRSTKAPDTGENTQESDNNTNIMLYILPVVATIVVGAIYIKRANKSHRKFD